MTLHEEIKGVRELRDPTEYIKRVKEAVLRELLRLDPQAQVADTHYFSHSAIPDFIVSWRGSKDERAFYIRDSMESYLAGRDVDYLPLDSAGIVTLDIEEPQAETTKLVSSQIKAKPRTLLASAASLDELHQPTTHTDPIRSMARAHFVRGARGLIDNTVIKALRISPEAETEALKAADEVVLHHFVPESAHVIKRTADLLRLADHADDANLQSAFEGRLSLEELTQILPWVLSRKKQPTEEYFRQLGEMFDFATLERLGPELNELDLTRLIRANADHWTATRAYGGLFVRSDVPPQGESENAGAANEEIQEIEEPRSVESHDAPEDENSQDLNRWNFRGAKLGLDMPQQGQRLEIVHRGTLLKGRPSASSLTWKNLERKISGQKPIKVDLRGLRRSVVVNAEDSPDIRHDVQKITETVTDTYYVQSVTVRGYTEDEDPTDITVDFGQNLAIASEPCRISDLLSVGTSMLITNTGPSDVAAL